MFLYFSKLEQSNYWKIFGLLEKGFNRPAHLHSAVRCHFELAARRAPGAQQLRSSACAWWTTYTAAIQGNHQVSWDEFCKAFCGHNLPAGTMHRSMWEFLDPQQGTDNLYEYIRKFNYLAQYGTHHVDTDEKKAELFRRGLSLPLQDRLVQFCDMSFNALVSATIAQDGTYRALLVEEEGKRKRDLSEPLDDSTEGAPPPSLLWDHHPTQQKMSIQNQPQRVLPQAPIQSPQKMLPQATVCRRLQ
jgi:hypothetical protein